MAVAVLAGAATGCIKEPDNELYVRFGMTEHNILTSGNAMQRRLAPPAPPAPLYCYKTIGVVDCSHLPEPGEGAWLVGHYGPPPF